MNKGLIIGGIAVIGGGALAYYLYNKNKATAGAISTTTTTTTDSDAAILNAPTQPVYNSPSTAPAAARQTMWKDVDGHIFELTTQEDKYGFLLKVDGGGSSKAVTVALDSSGHINTTNKAGERWVFKNGWSKLGGLNGIQNMRALQLGCYAMTN